MFGLLTFTAEALLWPFGVRRRRGSGDAKRKTGDSQKGVGGNSGQPTEDGGADEDGWEIDPVHFFGATMGMTLAWWALGKSKSSPALTDGPSLYSGPSSALPRMPLSEFLRLLKAGAISAVTYVADREPAGSLVVQAAVPTMVAAAAMAPSWSRSGGSSLGEAPRSVPVTTVETLLIPGCHGKLFEDLHACEEVRFECAEVESAGNWGNNLSVLIDVGGLLAAVAALWYVLRGPTPSSFSGKRLEETPRPGGDRRPAVTFDDVAGMDSTKEELREVISFLQSPSGFYALGARPPRGLLLAGPSGTGKTLLARAVAGESGVPFLYASAAAFVEVYVGQGAQRIRQFYEQARACAPCIVFLDELDSVGTARRSSSTGGEQEYAQTLNQLLLELDGVESHSAEANDSQPLVVTIAATNRYDCLDEALIRPGRLDRVVLVGLPGLTEREATLRIHSRRLKTEGIDFQDLARRTEGASGADLANLLNEAALLAARRGSSAVRMEHVFEVLANPRPTQTTAKRGNDSGATPQELFSGLCAAMSHAMSAKNGTNGGTGSARSVGSPAADEVPID